MAAMTSFHKGSLILRHFESDWDEIWRECSASKYA